MENLRVPAVPDGPDTISILITTDNHIGYAESDAVTGDDAWKTFQEILSLARENDVDMILQAGDLFHINKPSKKSLYHTVRLLRQYCLGDKPCELETVGDSAEALSAPLFNYVNYEDPNLNVAVPMFAIAGNHDDAAGDGLLAPLDVLASTGLVNHFGHVAQNDDISVVPLLFQKGVTKLALYGISSIRDERLFRTFRAGKVKFLQPDVARSEWFHLLAVHQNHTAHSSTGYLPEHFLPNLVDFVIWGHEHECIPEPRHNAVQGFDVLQPGSSVATSLAESEQARKHVFVLKIHKRKYSLQPLALRSVRPFVLRHVALADTEIPAGPSNRHLVTRYLVDTVAQLVEQAKTEWIERQGEEYDESMPIPLPLVRLNVDYSGGYEVENPRRFSNRFVGVVANVNGVVNFHKRRSRQLGAENKSTKLVGRGSVAQQNTADSENADEPENVKIQELVQTFLGADSLELLPENGLNEAVRKFVDKDDRNALKEFVDASLQEQLDSLLEAYNVRDPPAPSKRHTVLPEPQPATKRQTPAPRTTKPRKPGRKAVKSKTVVVSGSDSDAEMADVAQPPPTRQRQTRLRKPTASPKNAEPEHIEIDSEFSSLE